MDTALQNAINARDRLRLEIKTKQAELAKAEAFIELHGIFAGESPSEGAAEPQPSVDAQGTVTLANRRFRIVDVAAGLLAQHSPMKTSELLDRLDALGVRVGGAERSMNLASMLSRDPRFTNKRGEGWSLAATETAMPSSVGAELGI